MIEASQIKVLIDRILDREGGYVNHSADKGGPTNYGITQATLSRHRGRQVTAQEVRALTKDEARNIYVVDYVEPFAFIDDARLLDLVVDCGVNHGVKNAAKFLQYAAGVEQDGVIGPRTKGAVQRTSWRKLYARVLSIRFKFYGSIITKNPKQSVFALGWMTRAAAFLEALE